MGSNTRFSYFLFLISWKLSEASFCGNAAIPYSFEATKTGQPVLGCARPACFGWTAEGKALSSTPAFYRVNKKPDGFLRKDHKEEFHRVVDMDVAENFSPQNARCPTTFEHEQCPRDDQWVGGIAPVTNVSGLPLALQCCTYEKLGLAEDRGVAVVNQGQIVVGGEVMKDGRQYAFDYIADIVKHVKSDGMISYDVSLRRMPCLPTPSEYTLTVDDSVIDKLLDKAGKSIELLKSTSNEVPSARRFKSKHHDETTEVEKISVSSAEHVTPRNSAKAVWDDHPSVHKHHKKSYEEKHNKYEESWEEKDKRRHDSSSNERTVKEVRLSEDKEYKRKYESESSEEKEKHHHKHHHHKHQTSEEVRDIENFKDKLIMELGEKLLQNQHNVTYPPANAPVLDVSQVEKVTGNPLHVEDSLEGPKAKAHGVEQQSGSDNVNPFDEKEIRRSFYPVGGCGSCNCGCQTCSCYTSCCGNNNYYSCFTADTMVRTVDGKHIRMDELTLEDWVLSPNKTKMIYTPMETWIHRLPSAYTNFIKFTLENGKMLKITNKHFIYKTTCDSNLKSISIEDLPIQPVYAEKVEVDDCLYVVDKYNKNYKMSQSKVVKKEHVYEKGLYAPMTVTSDIVVNDIVASCYNIINHREMQFSFFHNVKKLASWSRLLYGETNEDLDIPLATSFLVDLLQYILPNSIIPS